MSQSARLKMDDNIIMTLGTKLYSQPIWWILVKELIQNALDAGATRIKVSAEGQNALIVEDNGCGMTEEQIHDVFLKVGGTDKERTAKTVGGFGIAKLAIFSCQDFEVSSLDRVLTKATLLNHDSLGLAKEHLNGTKVYVYNSGLLPYAADRYIKWYIAAVNRPEVSFYFNDDMVSPHDITVVRFPGSTPFSTIPPYSHGNYEILVRANGLPLFRQYINSPVGSNFPGLTFLYDIETDLLPYDPDYPFSVTREGFVSSTEHATIVAKMSTSIRLALEEKHELEEETRRAVDFNEEHKIWTIFSPQIEERALSALEMFKSQIEFLYFIKGEEPNCEFGLAGNDECHQDKKIIASYQESKDGKPEVFYLSDDVTDPALILASAIHEFTHRYHQSHYEEFASTMTEILAKYFSVMARSRKPGLL